MFCLESMLEIKKCQILHPKDKIEKSVILEMSFLLLFQYVPGISYNSLKKTSLFECSGMCWGGLGRVFRHIFGRFLGQVFGTCLGHLCENVEVFFVSVREDFQRLTNLYETYTKTIETLEATGLMSLPIRQQTFKKTVQTGIRLRSMTRNVYISARVGTILRFTRESQDNARKTRKSPRAPGSDFLV